MVHSQHLIPPMNFGVLEKDLYRCGQPNELNFPFMEKLGLKTIVLLFADAQIYLAPEEPNQRFLDFVDDQGIQ